MGERLYFLWLRFRWLIVVGTVLLAVGGGALAQLLERPSDPDSAVVEKPAALGSTVGAVETGSLLEGCAGLEDDEELYTCRTNLPAAMPVVLDADRTSLLGPGGWLKLDGQGVPRVATGISAEELEGLASGFTADLDNDGYPEHVLVIGGDGGGVLRVLSGVDAANMQDTAGARGLGAGRGIRTVLPFDANEDGWMDIVVVNEGTTATSGAQDQRGVYVHLNAGWEGPGVFRAPAVVRLTTALGDESGRYLREPVDAKVTDLDADGHVDLVLVDSGSVLGVYWGDGKIAVGAARTEPSLYRVPMGVTGMTLDDIDEDGRTDVLVTYDIGMGSAGRALCLAEKNNRPCTVYPGQSAQGGAAVLTQGEARSFTPNQALSVADVTYLAAVAVLDLDADGDKEIVLGREPLEDDDLDNLVVYEPVRTEGRTVGYEQSNLRLPEVDPVGRITGADVDGNGSIDLLLTGRGAKRLQTWLNESAGVRTLRLRIDGSAGLESQGTARGAIGAIVTVTDVNDRTLKIVVDATSMHNGVTAVLPLDPAAWSGDEAVPRVDVEFPVTGRRVELKNVATDRFVAVVEPAS